MSETKCSTINGFLLCRHDKLSERLTFHCIHSCSLTLRQNPFKTYHSVARNVTYKFIPSFPLAIQNLTISGPTYTGYVGKR
jgi:hypothetical protein